MRGEKGTLMKQSLLDELALAGGYPYHALILGEETKGWFRIRSSPENYGVIKVITDDRVIPLSYRSLYQGFKKYELSDDLLDEIVDGHVDCVLYLLGSALTFTENKEQVIYDEPTLRNLQAEMTNWVRLVKDQLQSQLNSQSFAEIESICTSLLTFRGNPSPYLPKTWRGLALEELLTQKEGL